MKLEREIKDVIAGIDDDEELADELQKLSRGRWDFPRLIAPHLPTLYRRNRRVFLPSLETWATAWTLQGIDENLERWLQEVEANGDHRLFRPIFTAWLNDTFPTWHERRERWQQEVVQALRAASDRAARRDVVEKLDIGYDLSDEFALELYEIDPVVTKDWVADWLDRTRWHDTVFTELAEAALAAGDEDFYFELYRKSFPPDVFLEDALRLCEEIRDPERLCDELRRRHLESEEFVVPPQTLLQLLERRGADVVPYLVRVVPDTMSWGRNETFQKMARIAEREGWWNLWGVIVRNHSFEESFSVLVARLSQDRDRPDWEVAAQLSRAAGAQRGWGNWRRFVALSEESAALLYDRFETLTRTVFAPHFLFAPKRRWGGHTDVSYESVAELALERGDTEMIDLLASHAILSNRGPWAQKDVQNLRWYEQHYKELSDEDFAPRALRVLGRLVPFEHHHKRAIRQQNPLYDIFFSDPTRYRPVAGQLSDFLEANNDDVHHLGLRVLLASGDSEVAAHRVRHLCAFLLDASRRATRILAFGALAMAGRHDEETGRLVCEKARATLSLRQKQYPRDRLVELIGQVIHAWPALREPSEQPVIYEHQEAS